MHILTGTRYYGSDEPRDFTTTVNAATYYSAVRQFHEEVSDADGTFNVDL